MAKRKGQSLIKFKQFSSFHKFRAHYLPIFESFGVFKPKNTERTIRVCYASSLSIARYLTEDNFVKLFDYQDKMEAFLKTVDITQTCEQNRTETFTTMSSPNNVILDATRVKKVLFIMSKQLGLMGHSFETIGFTEALSLMPKSTSSSFPDYITPKSNNFDNLVNQRAKRNRIEEFRFVMQSLIVTQWRTQINRSNKLKFRQFYPLPHYIQALERRVFNGFFLHFDRYKDTPYAYANIWPNLRRRYNNCQKYRFTYSLDIKGFDMNVSHDIIKLILEWMSTFLRLSDDDRKDLNLIIEYHLDAIILLSTNRKATAFNKKRGLLSGSTLTNLVGSLVSMFCLQYYALHSTGAALGKEQLTLHGDDNIFASDMEITLDSISKYFKTNFGSEISIEKSEVFKRGEKIYFLGHYIDSNGRYLNKDRMIHQLCFGSHYIAKDVMSSSERMMSKLCSLLFKCTDGWETFLSLKDKLLGILDLSELPDYYKEFAIVGSNISIKKFSDARDQWMLS